MGPLPYGRGSVNSCALESPACCTRFNRAASVRERTDSRITQVPRFRLPDAVVILNLVKHRAAECRPSGKALRQLNVTEVTRAARCTSIGTCSTKTDEKFLKAWGASPLSPEWD